MRKLILDKQLSIQGLSAESASIDMEKLSALVKTASSASLSVKYIQIKPQNVSTSLPTSTSTTFIKPLPPSSIRYVGASNVTYVKKLNLMFCVVTYQNQILY